ncbi:MAG: AAA family ATPase [Syntrophales bacterium]|nr:AAA family ATPase [Syntrophales bacterium]
MRISKIRVNECGPLVKKLWLDLESKDLILIYGRNESGKSFLTDLIINSLFKVKKKNDWGYIRQQASGKITLVGCFSDRLTLEFTPKSRKKLEDYIIESTGYGLPPELVKLLVVRAGEVEIIRSECGLTVEFLKTLFSQQRILNKINEEIGNTFKKATLLEDEGWIDIVQQASEAKSYHQLKTELRHLEELLQEVVEKCDLGELRSLQDRKKELEERKRSLELARNHHAYVLFQGIVKLEERLSKLPTKDEIDEIKNKIENFRQKTRETAKLEEQLLRIEIELKCRDEVEKELNLQDRARRYMAYILSGERNRKFEKLENIEQSTRRLEDLHRRYVEKLNLLSQEEEGLRRREEKVEEYLWLKAAKEHYLKLREDMGKSFVSLRLVLFATLFLALAGMVLQLFDKPGLSFFLMILTLMGLILLMVQISRPQTDQAKEHELRALKDRYQMKYGQELCTFADLEAREKYLENEFYEFEVSKKRIDEWSREFNALVLEINSALSDGIDSKSPVEERLKRVIEENKSSAVRLKQECEEITGLLARLDVKQEDFECEDPRVEFRQEELERLKVKLDRINQAEMTKEHLSLLYDELNVQLNDLRSEINNWFVRFGDRVEPEFWEKKLREWENLKRDLEAELSTKRGELKGFGVPEEKYVAVDPGEEYSLGKVQEVEEKLEVISSDLTNLEDVLRGLRQKVAISTGCDFSASWNVLLDSLFRKIGWIRDQLKKVEACLISKILLSSTIRELDGEEAKKIEAFLNDPEVSGMIYRLTKRYDRIFLAPEDEGKPEVLFVSDGTYDFKLADLSTGTREQVLLALRIAFLKKLLRGEGCFLFLDDAFQHTDYERRPFVVESLVELASSGWQIFYLTMDDHIRDLFQRIGSQLGERYQYIHLN